MNTRFIYRAYILVLLIIVSLNSTTFAQVGIGTTSPNANALLEIGNATTNTKGLILPRVNLVGKTNASPLTDHVLGMIVYNKNTFTDVYPGFYFNTGSSWYRLSAVGVDDWSLLGNTGTTPGVAAGQNYLGTSDSQNLIFATNATKALTISTSQQLLANNNGTNSSPSYSFDSDTNIGMWRSDVDRLNFSAGGIEFIELFEGTDDELRINDSGLDVNFRVETNADANAFFIDGNNNNIGFGTNSPNTSSQLELANNNQGILINRVSLVASNNAAPITSPATGLLVYNIAASSSGSTAVSPGFYYWDGSKWIAMGGTNGKDWSLLGNAGTNSSTNFLGTTDNTSLIFRTNNSERMRLVNDGRVTINDTNPFAGDRFTVTGANDEWAINGYSSGAGVGVYGANGGTGYGVYGNGANIGVLGTSVDGNALHGQASGTGLGVFGYSANNHGIYGTTAYTGGSFLTGGIIGWANGANGANGILAIADKTSSTSSNMGLRAVSGSTTSISSSQVMNVALNANATDLALYALTEKSSGIRETARFQTNYSGSPSDADSRDMRAQLAGYTNASQQGGNNMYYGGYFYSGGVNNGSWAYAGARYGNTNYKIIGNGGVSTIVDGATKSDTQKIMFASEAPEVLFEDYGIGQLHNGIAAIAIDPIFANNILVDDSHPLKVFIQLEGDCNGVFVTDKSGSGFIVKELKKGKSNVSFSWHIVANRKDTMGRNNVEGSLFSDLRFPDAPKAIMSKENIKNELEEINNENSLSNKLKKK